jgi:hypothetical protein
MQALLVEPEFVIQDGLAQLLRQRGLKVYDFSDPGSAWSLLVDGVGKIDVAVVDYPEKTDGRNDTEVLLDQLATLAVPTVLISGLSREEIPERRREALMIIEKPFADETFGLVVSRAMREG